MNILKYVVSKKKIPVIFSKEITHSDVMADAISAGFLVVKFDVNYKKFIVKCFGESSSLNLKNGDEDEYLIENFLNSKFHTVL
jgi:hypothetical protein